MLNQAVSEHFGQLTSKRGFDDFAQRALGTSPIFFDKVINRALKDLAHRNQAWRLFLARCGATPLPISYEKLCESPFSFVLAIARRVSVDPERLRHGYSEAASHYKVDSALPVKKQAAAGCLSYVVDAAGVAEFVRILMRS